MAFQNSTVVKNVTRLSLLLASIVLCAVLVSTVAKPPPKVKPPDPLQTAFTLYLDCFNNHFPMSTSQFPTTADEATKLLVAIDDKCLVWAVIWVTVLVDEEMDNRQSKELDRARAAYMRQFYNRIVNDLEKGR